MSIAAGLRKAALVATGAAALLAAAAAGSGAVAAEAPGGSPAGIVSRYPGPDGGWDYVTFDEGRNRIYVTRTYGVMAIDLTANQVIDHFADGARTHGVVVIPGGDRLLVTSGGDNTARLISAKDGALLATVPTGKGPDAAVYDPATAQVWVMDHAGGDITVIDPAQGAVVATIPVDGNLEFAAVDGKGRLYVNVEDKNQIAVVDTLAHKVVTRYALKGCDGPSGLALTDHGLLIAACDNKVAAVLKAASGKLVANLAIGEGPDAVIYDQPRERAYIPTGRDGLLWRIDLTQNGAKVVSSISTQVSGRTGAVNTVTGALYVPAAQFGPPPAPGQRPAITPGSFTVLVVKAP